MPEYAERLSARPAITTAEPQLFVTDIKTSCDFFTGKLGFAIEFTYGEPPYYAQVKRDGARLNLRCVRKPAIDPVLRDAEELLSASMVLTTAQDIRNLFSEYQANGVAFAQPLEKKPWGAQDF